MNWLIAPFPPAISMAHYECGIPRISLYVCGMSLRSTRLWFLFEKWDFLPEAHLEAREHNWIRIDCEGLFNSLH